MGLAVVLLVPNDVAIGGDGFLSGVDALVAIGHLFRYLTALRSLLGRGFRIGGLVFGGCVKIFTQSEVLFSAL